MQGFANIPRYPILPVDSAIQFAGVFLIMLRAGVANNEFWKFGAYEKFVDWCVAKKLMQFIHQQLLQQLLCFNGSYKLSSYFEFYIIIKYWAELI